MDLLKELAKKFFLVSYSLKNSLMSIFAKFLLNIKYENFTSMMRFILILVKRLYYMIYHYIILIHTEGLKHLEKNG